MSGPAPATVVAAARLWPVVAALDVVSAVLGPVLLPRAIGTARLELAGRLRGAAGADLEDLATVVATGTTAVASMLALVSAALVVVLARRLLRGRRTARTALTALAALHLLGLLVAVDPGATTAAAVLGVATAVVAAAAAALSLVLASQPWFERRSAPAS